MFAGVSGQGAHDDSGFWGCFWKIVLCCCYPCFWWKGRSDARAAEAYWAAKKGQAAAADAAAFAFAANAAAPDGAYGAV